MKRISLLTLLFCVLFACKNNKSSQGTAKTPDTPIATNDEHHAKNSLDWAGIYSGTIPCADCKGILVALELREDGTYRYKSEYIGKSAEPFVEEGTFEWDKTNLNVISLTKKVDRPMHFLVQENSLLQLGNNKEIIRNSLADKYRLYKNKAKTSMLDNRRWVLKEIYGEPVSKVEKSNIVFIEFTSNSEIRGNGGCNSFFGSYQVQSGNQISFSGIGMTEMACSFKNYDQELTRALEEADNFVVVKEDELRLQTGKRAAHAIFTAKY